MKTTKDTVLNIIPFLLITAVIVLRSPDFIYRAEFWAEDSTEFFLTSLSHGAKSLFMPVLGYHFFISRIIAYAATFFPVLWAPYIYAIISLFVNVICIGYFTRDGFGWIIKSKRHRIVISLILAVGPGTAEVFMNLCNLMNPLAFLAVLVLVEEPREFSWKKFLIITLLLFSSGLVFILAPVVIILWYITRDWRYGFIMASFLAVTAINFFGNADAGAKAGLLDYRNFIYVPKIIAENFIIRLVYMPFLGNFLTRVFMRTPDIIFWTASLLALAVAAAVVFRKKIYLKTEFWILMITYSCLIATFGVIIVVRSYLVSTLMRETGSIHWGLRYSFLPGAVAMLIWFAIFSRYINDLSYKKIIAISAVILITFHSIYMWNSKYRRENLSWHKHAASLQKGLDMRKEGLIRDAYKVDSIPVHPRGWHPDGLVITIYPDKIEYNKKIY